MGGTERGQVTRSAAEVYEQFFVPALFEPWAPPVNEGMLAVAKRKAPALEWRAARAEALPFAENSFDAVVSQFGLMFFEDQRLALQEMKRVLQWGGRLAVAVWDSLEHFEGYKELTSLIARLHGEQAAAVLHPRSASGTKALIVSVC